MSEHGDPRLPDRFWDKVIVSPSGCWCWTGCYSHNGYGLAKLNGSMTATHRAAYAALVGPVPPGKQLDHLCRNRACCNPAHLEPVSPRENVLRGMGRSATNAQKETCPRGHRYDYVNVNGQRGCSECNRESCRRWYQNRGAKRYRERRAITHPGTVHRQ